MNWKIVESERDNFIKKQLLNPRKGGGPVRLDSSGPSSPAMNQQPSQATERLMGVIGQSDIFAKQAGTHGRVKSPPRSTTPPLTSYPMATESWTPDRGPRPQHSFGGSFKQSPLSEQARFATPAKKLFQDSNAGGGDGHFHHPSEARPGEEQPSSPNVDPIKPGMIGLRDHSANRRQRSTRTMDPTPTVLHEGLLLLSSRNMRQSLLLPPQPRSRAISSTSAARRHFGNTSIFRAHRQSSRSISVLSSSRPRLTSTKRLMRRPSLYNLAHRPSWRTGAKNQKNRVARRTITTRRMT